MLTSDNYFLKLQKGLLMQNWLFLSQSAAIGQGLSGKSFEELCVDKKMKQVVLTSMAKTATEGKIQ